MSSVTKLSLGFGSALSALPLLVEAFPKLKSIEHLRDAYEHYSHTRGSLLAWLHVDASGFAASIGFDAFVLWLVVFGALHAFTYEHDGLSVWGHIKHSSCGFKSQGFVPQFACVLPKFLLAFLAAPLICLGSIPASVVTGNTYFSLAYVTVNPKSVARYMMVGMAGAATLVGMLSWAGMHVS